MTDLQKLIKYAAIAFASMLAIGIVAGCVGLLCVLGEIIFGDGGSLNISSAPERSYNVLSDIKKLEIDISAANLTIKQGESFSVESNLKNLKISETRKKLTLEEKSKIRLNLSNTDYKNAIITVYIPKEYVFEEVDITTGAGMVCIESLNAAQVEFELGAGDVAIDKLNVSQTASIEGGAGRVTLSDSVIRNLDIQMGIGQLNLQAALTGRSKMSFGVGESNVTLIGSRSDYSLDIEKGIGNINIEGKKVTDAGYSGGTNSVKISGGIGSINIDFTK